MSALKKKKTLTVKTKSNLKLMSIVYSIAKFLSTYHYYKLLSTFCYLNYVV